jgi:hypothetical protein
MAQSRAERWGAEAGEGLGELSGSVRMEDGEADGAAAAVRVVRG